MAKDPAIGPVSEYDAMGFPVNPEPVPEPVPEPEPPTVDLPAMRSTLEDMKMSELRAFAKDIGVKPARSIAETIDRIMKAFGEGMEPSDLPDDWQAPPLPVPMTTSTYGPPAPVEPVGKSVRIRRIEEAGKKASG